MNRSERSAELPASRRVHAGLFLGWTLLAAVHALAVALQRPPPGPDPVVPHEIDINRAPPAELALLPGIGPERAAAIVLERVRNGWFGDVDALRRVPGIGSATLDGLRPWIGVSAADTALSVGPSRR